ncbi:MAG TPA: TadE/TadG family type IV pilus assembly protein [Cryptosporangiaceae bacterium]|nr:TadE/TadG family type IV pilus assembly protein [Cryptosporangiaceae bacterium]
MRRLAPGRLSPLVPRLSTRLRGPRRPTGDAGSAVTEFSLVAVLLLMLLLSVAQVAVYLYIRNVATASAAEGARHAANADVEPDEGATRAADILRRGTGDDTADRLRCSGGRQVDTGVEVAVVRCVGAIPVFFAPLGGVLPVDVTARSIEEGQ